MHAINGNIHVAKTKCTGHCMASEDFSRYDLPLDLPYSAQHKF